MYINKLINTDFTAVTDSWHFCSAFWKAFFQIFYTLSVLLSCIHPKKIPFSFFFIFSNGVSSLLFTLFGISIETYIPYRYSKVNQVFVCTETKLIALDMQYSFWNWYSMCQWKWYESTWYDETINESLKWYFMTVIF